MKFVAEGDDSGSPSSPLTPTKNEKKLKAEGDMLQSSNSGDETGEDDYEVEMQKRRENTMGEEATSSLNQQNSSNLRKREAWGKQQFTQEELKKLNSSPESAIEGSQHFGRQRHNRGVKQQPIELSSDDDFADLDY